MSRINLINVGLEYTIYEGIDRSLKSKVFNFSIGGAISKDSKGNTNIVALKDICLDIKEGDRVGILGHNGAGKSTLLRVLSGAYIPQHGEINIEGRTSALFNSNLGIDPSATGYENIILRGLVLGFTKKKIQDCVKEVADFSGLGPFLDMPLRTYSEGMILRLAFSINTCIEPDILLMDEWLGAGDKEFIVKAEKKLNSLVDQSSILIIASHEVQRIRDLCDTAILMSHGEIIQFGPADKIVDLYLAT